MHIHSPSAVLNTDAGLILLYFLMAVVLANKGGPMVCTYTGATSIRTVLLFDFGTAPQLIASEIKFQSESKVCSLWTLMLMVFTRTADSARCRICNPLYLIVNPSQWMAVSPTHAWLPCLYVQVHCSAALS